MMKKKKEKKVVWPPENVALRWVRWTYGDDLGEEDGEGRLHRSIDHGAEGPHKDVRPLGDVQPQHAKEWRVGNFFILRDRGTEPSSVSLILIRTERMDQIWIVFLIWVSVSMRNNPPSGYKLHRNKWNSRILKAGCVINIDVINWA